MSGRNCRLQLSIPSPSFQRGGGGRGGGGGVVGRGDSGGASSTSKRRIPISSQGPSSSSEPKPKPLIAAKPESPTTATAESKKVAVVLSSLVSYCDFHTWVYSIQLDGAGCGSVIGTNSKAIPLEPVVCLGDGLPLSMAFSIKGSTLFMFGGIYPDKDEWGWESCMYTYRLKPALIQNPTRSTNRFQNELMKQGPNMKAPKVGPKAVVVCGKICVFSQLLSDANKPNFEIYDPTTSSWSELPEPFEYSSPIKLSSRSLEVQVCLQNSTMYILNSSVFYAFDFDPSSSCKTWKSVFFADPPAPNQMVGIAIDNFYFAPYFGFDLTVANGFQHAFHLLHPDDSRDFLAAVRGDIDIIYLGKGTLGDLRICTIRTGFKEDSFGEDGRVPHLLLDVFHCFTSQSRQLKIIRKKHFSFLLTKNKCHSIDFAGAFTL